MGSQYYENAMVQWHSDCCIYTDFITSIEMSNYKVIYKIYHREDDRKRAKHSIPVTAIYSLILCAGIGITGIVFEANGIENTTLPAMKICGLLTLGIMSATIRFLFEK